MSTFLKAAASTLALAYGLAAFPATIQFHGATPGLSMTKAFADSESGSESDGDGEGGGSGSGSEGGEGHSGS